MTSSRCSASTFDAPRRAASSIVRSTTCLRPTSIAPSTGPGTSRIASPQFDAGIVESPVMLLVHGLPGDAERLGDLRPAPAGPHGALDGGVLEPVGELAQRHDGSEVVGFGADRFRG